jgi:hypothetical protein
MRHGLALTRMHSAVPVKGKGIVSPAASPRRVVLFAFACQGLKISGLGGEEGWMNQWLIQRGMAWVMGGDDVGLDTAMGCGTRTHLPTKHKAD